MAVDVGSAVGYLDLDISGFLAGLKSAQIEADSTSKNIATKIGKNISGAGKKLTSVGTSLTKNVTVPLAAIGVVGLKVATDFEKGMSEVKAISGATGEDFDALREKAIELGADTAFSAGEVAEAMTEMAKAGWGSQQIIDGMGGVLDAAAASGESLATVSTIVADTITGFGMAASDSSRIADLLTQAANSGTIGITDLGESFKYIAPVAGAMGLSVEDVTTAISAMSMAGIKGSQAGTALRTMLTRLVKPTDDVAKTMEELGISVVNQDGSMKSLDEIVANLRTSFDGLTESEKAKYAATLAGQEGMAGMLSLLNLTEEEYNEIAKSMDNANGVAKKTATIMQDNLKSKVEQLVGSLESLAIKLSDYVIPYLQKFVEWLTKLVDKFTNLDPEMQKTILKIGAVAIVAGPTLAIVGKLTTGVGGLVSAFANAPGMISNFAGGISSVATKLGGLTTATSTATVGAASMGGSLGSLGTSLGSLASAAGPILAVVAVIAVLVAAFATLWQTNEDFKTKITDIWNQIKETFDNLTSGIVERINRLGFDFESIIEVITAVWQGFCDFLAPVFEGVFNYISIVFETFVNVFFGIWDFFHALFTGDWEGAWNAVRGIFESVWNGIKDWFMNILNVITGIFDTVLGWFGTSWEECWNGVKTFFMDIWNNVTTFLSNAWDMIKNVVQVGIMFVVELVKAAFNLITIPFRFIWENCKDTIMSVWDSIKTTISNVLTTIWTKITEVWNAVSSVISTVINKIWSVITSVFNSIKTTATNVWNGIKDAISGPINTAKKTVTDVVNTIKDKISSGFNTAKTTVSNVFTSIKDKIESTINTAKTTVSNTIDKIKGFFNFSWSLPKLKLPHVSIQGEFSLVPPSVPTFSVDWYSKAMNSGMILNAATIFGFNPKTGKFLGGGEAGSETVVGTNSLLNMIRQTVSQAIRPVIAATYQIAKASTELGYVTYNGFVKQAEALEKVTVYNKENSGGDTFIFNSPKPIDEIEAAKQMKKTKQDLAEGF